MFIKGYFEIFTKWIKRIDNFLIKIFQNLWAFIKLVIKYVIIVRNFIYDVFIIIIYFLWDHSKRMYIAAEPLLLHFLSLYIELLCALIRLLCFIWDLLKAYNRNFIMTGIPGSQIEDLIAASFYITVFVAIFLAIFNNII